MSNTPAARSKKTAILFVCHGNICRSPMAEFVMKHTLKRHGIADRFEVASAATTREEIGSDVHRGTRAVLDKYGIAYERRRARQIAPQDYERFDYIVGMDEENRQDLLWFFREQIAREKEAGSHDAAAATGKISLLRDWSGDDHDVADPWYTGNFEAAFDDISRGCTSIYFALRKA